MTNDQRAGRIQVLKEILLALHEGATPASIQEEFNTHFAGVSAIEIAMMEQELIFNDDNPITFEDVLKLCNVHANLFKGHVKEGEVAEADQPNHPVQVFKEENMALQAALKRVENIIAALDDELLEDEPGVLRGLKNQLALLGQFERHYQRKERLFFPFMERKGYDAPPKVMWAKDDEIRGLFKAVKNAVAALPDGDLALVEERFLAFADEFKEMIFKEEGILLNILLEALIAEDWGQISLESPAYGYAIINAPEIWQPEGPKEAEAAPKPLTPAAAAQPSAVASDKAVKARNSYQLDFPEGTLVLTQTDKQIGEAWDWGTPLAEPFTHGQLSLAEVEWVLDYLPFELRIFDAQGMFQYHNAAARHSQSPLLVAEELSRDWTTVFNSDTIEWLEDVQEAMAGQANEEVSSQPFIRRHADALEQVLPLPSGGFMHLLEPIAGLEAIDRPLNRELSAPAPVEIKTERPEPKAAEGQLLSQKVSLGGQEFLLTWESRAAHLPQAERLITFQGGELSLSLVNEILNTLPMELTVVNEQARFMYYNEHVDASRMVFKRTPAQLGRHLEFCHPPKVWEKVSQLIEELENKVKPLESMWFTNHAGQVIGIQYIALWSANEKYQGILEIVRDVTDFIGVDKH